MATNHTHVTSIELFVGGDDLPEIIATIAFTFTPGSPEWWCSQVGAYMPPDPPEIEPTGVTLADKAGNALPCPDWLGELILSKVSNDDLMQAVSEDA